MIGAKTSHEETLECLESESEAVPDESTVMSVAHAWSLDPTGLNARFDEVGEGHLGAIGELAEEDHGAMPSEGAHRPWWKFW